MILVTGLFADSGDNNKCHGYKVQYEKYIKKAKDNKLMASRYKAIAERYDSMYKNCEITIEQQKTRPMLMMRTIPDFNDNSDGKNNTEVVPQSVQLPAASSYRANPFNSIK